MKTVNELLWMGEEDLRCWLLEHKDSLSIIQDIELDKIITERDYWEDKATELAVDVGNLLQVYIGEHSSVNCPVQNAIEGVIRKL